MFELWWFLKTTYNTSMVVKMIKLFWRVFFSYLYEDRRGIFPETQYVFDIELPSSFEPKNSDGEMENFYSYSLEQVGVINKWTNNIAAALYA